MIVYIHSAHLVPILCNCKHFNTPYQCSPPKPDVRVLAQLTVRKRHGTLLWMSECCFHRLFCKASEALALPQQCIDWNSHFSFFFFFFKNTLYHKLPFICHGRFLIHTLIWARKLSSLLYTNPATHTHTMTQTCTQNQSIAL